MGRLLLPSGKIILPDLTRTAEHVCVPPDGEADPYFADVKLLLPMRGANGGVIFDNWGNGSYTFTVNGNTNTSTAQSMFYGSSGYFDGTGDYIQTTFPMVNSKRWTFEAWVRPVVDSTSSAIIGYYPGAVDGRWYFGISSGNKPYCWCAPSGYAGSTTLVTNTWYHLRWVACDGWMKVFVNGKVDGIFATPTFLTTASAVIGNYDTSNNNSAFAGYMQDLRFTDNVCRSFEDFIPPGRLVGSLNYAPAAVFPKPVDRSDDWTRPSDWLPMPPVSATEQKICILHAVFNHDSNFAAFTIAGNYTVDWGDGTVDNVNSGATATHAYSYSNSALSGTECSRGYKQAMITITPQAGSNLTSVNFGVKYTGLADSGATGFLDFILSAPSMTALTFSVVTAVKHSNLERAIFLSSGAITTLLNLFYSCHSLQKFSISGMTLSGVTSLNSAFRGCNALRVVDLSNCDFSSISSILSLFYSCATLTYIDISSLNASGLTALSNMCQGCSSLLKINLPSFSSSAITTIVNAFYGCSRIQEINLSTLTSSVLTTTTDAFLNCYSLASLSFPSRASFDISNCRLSSAALNTLYAQLPTGLTGKTLTVTGNYGTSGDDPSLRPAGWEITG